MQQEHEHSEGSEGFARYRRALQSCLHESRGGSKRAGAESLLGNLKVAGRDLGIANQRLSFVSTGSQTLRSRFG